MKITLMVVGKTGSANLRAGIEEYSRRINRYIPLKSSNCLMSRPHANSPRRNKRNPRGK